MGWPIPCCCSALVTFVFVLIQQTVYQAGRVEGVLRLEVPPVNLGYEQVHAGAAVGDSGEVASTAGGEANRQLKVMDVANE